MLLLGIACGAVLLWSLLSGSADIPWRELGEVARGGGEAVARTVVLDLRLPRTLTAFGVGAVLALAGLLLQALFRNPLADPYVLGVSGGAAVGALLAMLLGAGALATQSAAAGGAFLTVTLVWLLGARGGTQGLLLTGVVVAAACGAIVQLILSLSSTDQLRGMMFWLAGDLSWGMNPALGVGAAVIALAGSILLARPLNVLAAGELRAQSVGLDTRAARLFAVAGCSVLAAIAVVSAGTIGFVGLIAPHTARLLFRSSDHRIVAPAAAMLGGLLVALADLFARTALEPRQLPVGGIMALVGAPLFLSLLRRAAR